MTGYLGTEFIPPTFDTDQVLWGIGYLMVAPEGTPLPSDENLGNSSAWMTVPSPTTPSVPASNATATNTNSYAVNVTITGGTLTAVTIEGAAVGSTAGTYYLPAGDTIAITYSAAPTWTWTAPSTDTWNYVGSTQQGVQTELNPSMTNLQIEEQPIPVASLVNTATYTITTSMSEETLNNINLAYGSSGTITVTPAGTGQPGKSVLTLSDNFSILAAAILGKNEEGFPRVFYVPKIMSAGQVTTAFRRAAEQRLYPLTLNALCDLSQMQIIDITAPATS